MPSDAGWTCPTCQRPVASAFCPTCGESPTDAREHTLRGLLSQLLNSFTAVDGKLMRSFQCLLQRPGMLSVAYLRGQRLLYTPPFRIFLFANMLFFAMQSLTRTSIVSETLESHLHEQDWSAIAQRLVAGRLAARGTTLQLYAPVFDHAVTLNAKTLIILMVLPFTLMLAATFPRRPFVAHAVFALHFYASLMLLFCVLLAIAAVDSRLGGSGWRTRQAAVPADLGGERRISVRRNGNGLRDARGAPAAQVLVLTLLGGAMISGYRFVIFLITLYTT